MAQLREPKESRIIQLLEEEPPRLDEALALADEEERTETADYLTYYARSVAKWEKARIKFSSFIEIPSSTLDTCIDDHERAIKLNPQFSPAYLLCGAIYQHKADQIFFGKAPSQNPIEDVLICLKKAEEYLDKAVEINPAHQEDAEYQRATIPEKRRRYSSLLRAQKAEEN